MNVNKERSSMDKHNGNDNLLSALNADTIARRSSRTSASKDLQIPQASTSQNRTVKNSESDVDSSRVKTSEPSDDPEIDKPTIALPPQPPVSPQAFACCDIANVSAMADANHLEKAAESSAETKIEKGKATDLLNDCKSTVALPPIPVTPQASDCCGNSSMSAMALGSEDASSDAVEDRKTTVALPPRPPTPQPSDCCGNGCSPCVMDLHDEEVKLWQRECHRLLHGECEKQEALSSDQYTALTLSEVTQQTCDSSLYRFSLPHPDQTLGINAGQHLILRWLEEGRVVTRQYTPVSHRDTRGHFDVVIKLYPEGVMSQYIKSWKCGDEVEWRGPCGDFMYYPNQHRHLLLLAAGTGIAPMIQVINQVLENEEDDTMVELVYCCRSYQQLLCKAQIDRFSDFWNFSAVFHLSDDKERKGVRYGDKVLYQRLTGEDVQQRLESKLGHTRVLVCGTRSFEADVIRALDNIGVQKKDVHKF